MLLQDKNKGIAEIRKKDRKIYERGKCSLKKIKKIWKINPVKVSFCTLFRRKADTLRKGSLAVETVFVLPLFFLGMVTLISFMDIYKLQTEHLTALCTRAKQAGMYAYIAGESSVGDITLPDIYTYKAFGGLIPLSEVAVYNHVKVHAWTGTEYQDNGGEQGETEQMVYVTESGSVYHRKLGCRYLKVSIQQVAGSGISSMRNSYGEKYAACESCSRGQKSAGSVYVTSTGNRYHNQETCSGLKRTVKLVKLSQAGSMHACSSCG